MVRTEAEVPQSTRSSIAGGFVLVPVAGLMACWRACQSAPLGIGDFRSYLAAHEMKARRCRLDDGRPGAYSVAELAKLLGVSERRAKASVNRLVAAGLLEWSDGAIGFPDPMQGFDGDLDDPDLENSIGQGRGSIAIPRRMLRFLVAGARPALIATVLGLLLRCLSRRKAGFDGRGRCKASWIARVFGVDPGRVKLARAELVKLGWIEPESSDQWSMNRYGKAFRIDLDWDRPDCRETIPPRPPGRRETTPPDLHQEPLQERIQNQEPCPGPSGFSIKGSGNGDKPGPKAEPRPGPKAAYTESVPVGIKPVSAHPGAQVPTPTLPTPTLADVRIEDLKDTGRLLDLHRQAVDRQLIGASEADRLKFVAAAEHALAIGKGNPPGLFAWLVRGACWRYITQEDEDRANARIKAFLRGPELPKVASSPRSSPFYRPIPPTPPVLSEDARTVREIRRAMERAGYSGDPFPQVRRADPSWTRDRWDAALAELGT
jgi:hypothetical protein